MHSVDRASSKTIVHSRNLFSHCSSVQAKTMGHSRARRSKCRCSSGNNSLSYFSDETRYRTGSGLSFPRRSGRRAVFTFHWYFSSLPAHLTIPSTAELSQTPFLFSLDPFRGSQNVARNPNDIASELENRDSRRACGLQP